MHGVTQKIEFCYGHRIRGHAGKCGHLHGHNGVIELSFVSERLDSMGMVIDFDLIQSRLSAWVNRELDHAMILERTDPLAELLKKAGEPVFELGSAPTAEVLAKLVFDQAREVGLPVVEVRLWETPAQFASYRD